MSKKFSTAKVNLISIASALTKLSTCVLIRMLIGVENHNWDYRKINNIFNDVKFFHWNAEGKIDNNFLNNSDPNNYAQFVIRLCIDGNERVTLIFDEWYNLISTCWSDKYENT